MPGSPAKTSATCSSAPTTARPCTCPPRPWRAPAAPGKGWTCSWNASAGCRQGEPWADLPEHLAKLAGDFIAALDDDLNIAAALAALFNFQREINTRLDQGLLDEAGAQAILNRFREFDQVLGVMNFPLTAADADIDAKVQARETARRQKDFAQADRLRQELAGPGHRNPGHPHRPRLAPPVKLWGRARELTPCPPPNPHPNVPLPLGEVRR